MVILMCIHVVVTLAMIGVILMQRNEGGGLGMGSPSNSMFSVRGTANLLTRATAVLFGLFVLISLLMGIMSKGSVRKSIIESTSVEIPGEKS